MNPGVTLNRGKTILALFVTLAALAAGGGCAGQRGGASCRPSGVEIVRLHPFTSIKGPDEGGQSDGVDVRVEALNATGRPVKAFGEFRLELYGYRAHQADPAGQRLATWTLDLSDPEANERYWDAILLAYKIPLGGQRIPPKAKRLVLKFVFQGCDGQRLFDSRVLDVPAGPRTDSP